MSVASVNRLRIERVVAAPLAAVWELWTTKAGLEAWWGPDGFRAEVKSLEVKPGGACEYEMIPVTPEMIAFMERAGAPASQRARFEFAAVEPMQRLLLTNVVDFVPGVARYQTQTEVHFEELRGATRVLVWLDPMHDELWTGRMRMGWEQQLGKLERAVA